MKNILSLLTGVALAAASATGGLLAQESAPLRIFTAVEVDFSTESGKVYQLQGSSNLVDWVKIGAPVFGVGRDVTQVFSTRQGGEVASGSYRVESVAPPTNALAPWSLAGTTLSLDDTPGDDLMQFTTSTNGVDLGDAPDPFRYRFTRVDADTVRADVDYGAGKKDVLTLTFTALARGTWVREEYRKERLKDRDLGVFSVVSNTIPDVTQGPGTPPPPPIDPGVSNPDPTSSTPPAVLAGLIYQFQSGEHPDRIEFSTASSGIEVGDDGDDDEPNRFTYLYTATGTNTATVVLTFKPGRHDDYDLIFNSDGRGTFTRREFRDDLLKDTDHGAFSAVTGGTDHGGGPGGTGGDSGSIPAGPSLEGVRYRFATGETPDLLTFNTATAGVEQGDSDVTSFTYTFSKSGDSVALLVIRFKADKWDEYDLTFVGGNRGTFVRREFDDGALEETDNGTFTGL